MWSFKAEGTENALSQSVQGYGRSPVGSDMLGEVVGGARRVFTAGAREGLLPSVLASVHGQLSSGCERAAAVTTLEGPVSGVHCSDVP